VSQANLATQETIGTAVSVARRPKVSDDFVAG
jgi:hypothetical protein